ncbi:fimbrillin family protein [uncultured Bacteroides sp.]|uniref:fimbrillin family protein n=1 Tax=uncultured Bacteroides sp. TaxID=162156 RepID=UPI002609D380|nr:fimbrillin family protein [uncultured Bacteroides sp.]
MKTMYHIWLAAAVTLVAATSCSNENALTEDNQSNKEIRLNCVHPSASRVTDTNFEAQDQIGVYMVTEGEKLQIGGNELNNEQFNYDGATWTSVRSCFWNDGTHDIYAYYPYATTISDTDNYPFTVSTDQSTPDGYEASDFLWASRAGVTASAEAVTLTFKHCLSKIKVKLLKSEDFTGEIPDNCEVYIHNLVPMALVDLQTGSVEADPYTAAESIKCRKLSTTEFTACVVPQFISSRRPLVEVVTSNVSYMLEGTISLKQGYQSTISVTLSQNPEQVSIEIGGGMGEWNN